MEFDETPRFWYSCVSCDVWIDFYSRTVGIRPSEYRENPHFSFLSPLSLSFSISDSSSLSFLVCSPFFFLFLFSFSFLSLYTESPSHCLFLSHFLIFSSFSFFFFIFSFGLPSSVWSTSGKLPPHFLHATCLIHKIS